MRLSALSILLICASNFFGKVVSETNEDLIIYQKYLHIDGMFRNAINSGVKMILPYVMEVNEQLNISTSCRRDIFLLISEIRKYKLSAFNFLDATGKLSDGIFNGNVHMYGDYNQCLNTSIRRKDGTEAFRGQYCMLQFRIPLSKEKKPSVLDKNFEFLLENSRNFTELTQFIVSLSRSVNDIPLNFGLCVPSGCSSDDIEQVAHQLSDMTYMNVNLAYCDLAESTHFLPGRILAICLFSLSGLLLLLGSSLDYFAKKWKKKLEGSSSKFLLAFSALRNFPKVIDTQITDPLLTCLDGMRVLSLFYLILFHHYLFSMYTSFEVHVFRKMTEIPDFFFQIVLNGFLTVEVFFFIGGLCNCYTKMKANDSSKRKKSVLQQIIHRLWRLYPPYIFSILTVYLFYDGYGPMNTLIKQKFTGKCNKNWWKNILFIDNFFDQEDTCMVQSWYLAVDMQLFLLSLFVIHVIYRNAVRGILLSVGFIVIGLCSTVAIVWYKNGMPALILHNFIMEDIYKIWNMYATPLPHIASYFIGMIVGYVLYKKKDLKISKAVLCFGWIIAGVMFTSMLFVTKRWNAGVKYTIAESAFYVAFSRLVYILAVAWMVVCCARGYGGIINYILSLKIWIPLAKISYMAYLISPTIQFFYASNSRNPDDNHRMISVWKYVGDVTISCLMSLTMVVAIESPFTELEKLFFPHKSSKTEEQPHEVQKQESHENSDFRENIMELAKEIEKESISI